MSEHAMIPLWYPEPKIQCSVALLHQLHHNETALLRTYQQCWTTVQEDGRQGTALERLTGTICQ